MMIKAYEFKILKQEDTWSASLSSNIEVYLDYSDNIAFIGS